MLLSLLTGALAAPLVLTDATFEGRTVDLRIEDGLLTAMGPALDRTKTETRSLAGRTVVPAFIDAHVHLAYLPRHQAMLDGGIAGVVDWAAPLDQLAGVPPLRQVSSGPVLTPPGGYPTQSWGRNGYGLERSADDATDGVVELITAGAQVIKVALDKSPTYDDATLRRIVDTAHAADRKVGAHALKNASAHRACSAGVDVLVHTPVEPLAPDTVTACSAVVVISTLDAFGATEAALDNLRRLRAAGSTVVYGTDFGNSQVAGIQPREIAALQRAGFDRAAIVHAATTAPAQIFGFPTGLTVGQPASFLVLDPTADLSHLARPEQVWIHGVRRDRAPVGRPHATVPP